MTGRYSIATVTQLTGVPPETLRTWERRYGIVVPERTEGGQRRYSRDDVERLRLVARLVERGERVSTVAGLSREALEERLAALTAPEASRRAGLDVAVIGDPPAPLEGATPSGGFVRSVPPVDAELLLVMLPEHGAEGPDPRELVEELRAAHPDLPLVAAYTYLPEAARRELADPWIRLTQLPRPLTELRQHLVDVHRALCADRPPPRPELRPAERFTPAQLARLADARNDLACACPNHAARLVQSLVAFEHYSLQCVDTSPEDAAIHQALAEGTARAREEMEGLLAAVCEHDGIGVQP